jgi:glycosyltransferase involved in cell wall biosynthesis
MTRRVLVLPRHSARAASGRHRFLQYLPYLKQHQFEIDVSPFFGERYTAALLDGGGKQWWRYGDAVMRRFSSVLRAGRYDLVVLHVEFIPFAPFVFERLLARLSIPFVLDFDDAFFHGYDRHRSRLVRALLGDKLGRLMGMAAVNCAGSDYLANYARRFSKRVQVVPTVVDLSRYPTAVPPEQADRFRIGWIGSPSTTPHLQSVVRELAQFAGGKDVELTAIGATPFDTGGLPTRWLSWSEDTEVTELARTHVGIMPLPDTPWAAGKCGFKLIQAMACWRPVIASPVGANVAIVRDGTSGLLATHGGWATALERLYADPGLRASMGAAGRHIVEREYSLAAWEPRLAQIWSDAARG